MRRPGVYGPYKHRNRWRLIVVGEGGKQTPVPYENEEDAREAKRAAEKKQAEQGGITVEQAIDQYEAWQKARSLKPNSYETTHRRLSKFLGEVSTRPIAMVTEQRASSIYSGWVTKIPNDSHLNMLAETKTFMNWCATKGWIKRNPFGNVKGIGKKRKGKTQLRFDEARKWYSLALDMANEETGALAAAVTYLFGLRASEVAAISVRDLDDDGRLLWVADSKTEAGRRTLEVPDEIRPMMQALAEGKTATDPLFGDGRTRYWVYYWVQRVCELANVQKVCAHAMRGLHGTTAVDAGATPKLVAAALGHVSPAVTERHYLAPGTSARATQRAALGVINGGKKASRG